MASPDSFVTLPFAACLDMYKTVHFSISVTIMSIYHRWGIFLVGVQPLWPKETAAWKIARFFPRQPLTHPPPPRLVRLWEFLARLMCVPYQCFPYKCYSRFLSLAESSNWLLQLIFRNYNLILASNSVTEMNIQISSEITSSYSLQHDEFKLTDEW